MRFSLPSAFEFRARTWMALSFILLAGSAFGASNPITTGTVWSAMTNADWVALGSPEGEDTTGFASGSAQFGNVLTYVAGGDWVGSKTTFATVAGSAYSLNFCAYGVGDGNVQVFVGNTLIFRNDNLPTAPNDPVAVGTYSFVANSASTTISVLGYTAGGSDTVDWVTGVPPGPQSPSLVSDATVWSAMTSADWAGLGEDPATFLMGYAQTGSYLSFGVPFGAPGQLYSGSKTTIPTVSGTTYSLNFYFSAYYALGQDSFMGVWVNGQNAGIQTVASTVPGLESYTFVANGSSATIDVVGYDADSSVYAQFVPVVGPPQTTPTITWATPAAIPTGTALGPVQLNATTTVAGTFVYAPVAGTVLAVGGHTLNVTFNPTDAVDYTSATGSVSITVNPSVAASSRVQWTQPAPIPYGTPLSASQLNATATTSGTFTYSPPLGTVLSVGQHTLIATFFPNDLTDYLPATAIETLVVTQSTPKITWPQPAPIVFGTAVSQVQLDATSNVPGAWSYIPAAGTVLSAGVQTLTAVFTPTDSTDYVPAAASVPLTVNRAAPVVLWPTPVPVNAGASLSGLQLNATANIPGSFVYAPALGTTVLANQLLGALFTPTDSVDYLPVSISANLVVNPPVVAVNFSSLANVPAGGAASFGWYIAGTGNLPYLIRASGPALSGPPVNLSNALAHPKLTVFAGTAAGALATDTGWSTGPTSVSTLLTAGTLAGAFPWSTASADSAVMLTLAPGAYAAQVSGADGGGGRTLFELYPVPSSVPTATPMNFSSLVSLVPGSSTTSGFVLSGSGTAQVVVRAIGPGLASFGVAGSLAKPALTVYNAGLQAQLATDTGWTSGPTATSALVTAFGTAGAFPLGTSSADSAVLLSLGAGEYTAQVSGADGGGGAVLVEFYLLPVH